MIYQLNRPFQAHPIFFDLEDPTLCSCLPDWFGSAWQPAPSISRESAYPLLLIPANSANPLGQIQNFVYDHTTCRSPYFVFHGGAVTIGDDAYLFLASTTTGKTTLISYLTQLGYTYLNDDCFYLNMETLEVMPYSAPIHLRDGGLAYLKSVLPSEQQPQTVHIVTPSASRHVYLPKNQTRSAVKPKQIFFLDRTDDPSIPDHLTVLPTYLTLHQLFISALIPYQMNKEYIHFFQKLVPLCRRLTYHNASYVASLLPSPLYQEAAHD